MKADEIKLTPEFVRQVADLYHDMEAAYDRTAKELDFSCSGCPDNCCDSFFLHHTYTEWAYLWHGLKGIDDNLLSAIIAKASDYIIESEASLAKGERPIIMCPLNSEGRCALYSFISPAASDARSRIQQQTPWRLWTAPNSFNGW